MARRIAQRFTRFIVKPILETPAESKRDVRAENATLQRFLSTHETNKPAENARNIRLWLSHPPNHEDTLPSPYPFSTRRAEHPKAILQTFNYENYFDALSSNPIIT
mmetsp:Transcript_22067/g.89488  ORF Transcript_22067/g.89488 Transcript_22067/m.89488 type:complete len:106 (-) Transcript_22067:124-441(-)